MPLNLDGYKIWAIGAIHSDWLNTLGAAAQTMSAVDMNQALDRDIIDGGIQGWSGMRTFGIVPFLIADILRLGLLVSVPALSLWLPRHLGWI